MPDADSFTQRVVAELAPHTPPLACCRRALVEGMRLTGDGAEVSTTRMVAARAAMSALHTDAIAAHVRREARSRRGRYVLAGPALDAVGPGSERPCCARSRLRGAFIAAGTVARPDAEPHLEILCACAAAAARLSADFAAIGVPAGVRRRRGRWLVAVRTTPAVGAALSSMGVQGGRLDFESGRVVRDVRSRVNRRINAETANLHRTAAAGVRQSAAAERLLADPERWRVLPGALREAALLRARAPQADLGELARQAGCSRSAMADRLRRLESAATAERPARVD